VAGQRFEENALLVLAVGLLGSALFLALAATLGRRILGRLGGELEPVVAATRRVAAGDLTQQRDSGQAAASSLVAASGDTRTDDLKEARRILSKTNILGTVLNKAPASFMPNQYY